MQNDTTWNEELKIVAAILNKAPLEKTIKWGAEVFTYEGKNVVSYGGFKHYFTIWFYNGVFLKDPHQVLVNAQEGKTKSLRQWRFTSTDQIDETKILEYVHEAIEVEKQGLKIKSEKKTILLLPELLEEEFNKNPALREAFEKLTLRKRNEFIIYLNEAKQEATKVKRLEKIGPLIL